jgi:hypothetical protein
MIRKLYKNLGFLFTAAGNSSVLLPLFRLFKKRYPCYAIPDADICIEGFPRSGNSFFVTAFQRWNPGIAVSHHSHLASNAKFSARHGKPTVILIRGPAEAIASAIAWDGLDSLIAPGVGILSYIAFYESLTGHHHEMLFLNFEEAVSDPGQCIRKINRRFGSAFRALELTEEESQQIKELLIRQDNKEKRFEMNSTLPNRKKAELKEVFVPRIQSHSLFRYAVAAYCKSRPKTDPES